MENVSSDIQKIIEMPKVELHLHLEGAFTFEFLFGLIQKYGGDKQVKTIAALENKFVFKNFEHFIQMWFWKNQFFRKAEDFEESAYSTLKNLANQNVIYTEVFFSPWDFKDNNVSIEEITEATISGKRRAENQFNIKCNLIADLVRDYGPKNAINRLDEITPYQASGVIGIGLGGNEQKFPPELFKEVFAEARKRGFNLTAHAGEAAGPESIWSALNNLRIERIGHGVRAIEDSDLVEYLYEKQMPLEICVNSNIKTNVFPSIESHPVRQFYKKGLNISISSDDPTMFRATITDEFISLYDHAGFSLNDIKKLTENAIHQSFISLKEKNILLLKMRKFWISKGIDQTD